MSTLRAILPERDALPLLSATPSRGCIPQSLTSSTGAVRICGFHLLVKLFVAQAAKHAYSNDCFVGSCRGFVMPAFSHTGVSCDRRYEDNPQLTDGELRGQAPCLKPHEGVNNG